MTGSPHDSTGGVGTLGELLYGPQERQRRADLVADDEARVVRIAEEALGAFRELAGLGRAVSVFGSAQAEAADRWGELARRTGAGLVQAGFGVITGGGPGLMAAANEGAYAAQGTSVGLTIHLPAEEEPNGHLSVHVPFHYFFLRKLAFVKYACAFVCLPGGYGTLDELFEALNLKRTLRIHPFPVILMGTSYWSGLVQWLRDTSVPSGTLDTADLEYFEVMDDPDAVVRRVQACHAELCRDLGIDSRPTN